MDCSDVRDNLAAAIDGELRDGDLAAVDAHLSTCVACRAERDAVHRLMTAAASTWSTVPASSLPAIHAEIDREIMLGLVDQVSALTAEVKALRVELASTRNSDTAATTHTRISAELTEDLDVDKMSEAAPIIRIAHAIVHESFRRKASQIHVEPTPKGVRIRYVIDGDFVEAMTVPKHIQNQLIERFKIMADLNIAERQVPQEGRMPIKIDGVAYELSVSCTPMEFGELIAMRIKELPGVSLSAREMVGDEPRSRGERQSRSATDVDQVVAQLLVRKPAPTSTSVDSRGQETERGDDPWSFAIS